MLVVIDGYNLLAQSNYKSRDELLKELKKYQNLQGHSVTVFFDGTHRGTSYGDRYMEGGVLIIFSPLNVTADEMIEEFLESSKQSNIVVVSSDRRVQSAAKAKKLSYLESKDFLFKLKHTPTTDKNSSPKPWMEGRTTEEEGERPTKKGGNPRKLSKKIRQKQKSMKKL